MAISYRSGATATSNSGTILTIAKPAGVVSGDVLLAGIASTGNPITAPAGWSASQTSGCSPTFAVFTSIFLLIAGGAEPADYTFTSASGLFIEGIIDAYVGVDNSTPMDTSASVAIGTTATITWPDITTVTDDTWHLAIVQDDAGIAVPPAPSTYTGRTVSANNCRNSDKNITGAGLITGITTTGGASWVAISAALRLAGATAADRVGFINTTSSAGRFIGWTI